MVDASLFSGSFYSGDTILQDISSNVLEPVIMANLTNTDLMPGEFASFVILAD